jgi:hypothetical protein
VVLVRALRQQQLQVQLNLSSQQVQPKHQLQLHL